MPVITSQVLPAEVLQVISEVVIQEAENRRIGRNIVALERVDKGAQTYKYRKFTGFKKENVKVIPEGAEFPLEDIDFDEVTVDIQKIGSAFAVTREENLANRIVSMAQLARDKARVVALKEDELIITDLLNNAGATVAASATWSSDTGNPYNDISNAMAKLEEYAYQANALVLHPNEAADLRRIDANAKSTYQKLIDGLGITVYVTPQISTGTGLLLDKKQAAALVIAEDITTEGPVYDQRAQTYLVNVYERIAVATWRPHAVVKLSGI